MLNDLWYRWSRPTRFTLFLVLIALLWRLIFWPTSQGAYTDGILQIDFMRQGLSFWPPLYALLTRGLAWTPGLGLESAARLLSLLAGTLMLLPLMSFTRRLFGLRTAVWAAIAWIVSPLALRWSLQVMTDMTMCWFWMASIASTLIGLHYLMPGLFPPHDRGAGSGNPQQARRWLLLASLTAALATLTRYQGILLLPPMLLVFWKLRPILSRPRAPRWDPWWLLLPWAAVPLWLLRHGPGPILAHLDQMRERTATSLGTSLLNYTQLFEQFLLMSPYFLTYGLFGFLVYGLLRIQWRTARLRWTGWLFLYLVLAILVLQSVFASFQSRYLLPLLPMACVFIGHGLATWQRHTEHQPLRRWVLILPTLGLALLFSTLVATYQGNPFHDLKMAARFIHRHNQPGPTTRIVSDEYYPVAGEQPIVAPKLKFWLRDGNVIPLHLGQFQPGDIIVVSSYYYPTPTQYPRPRSMPPELLPLSEPETFSRRALPLLPDIMQESLTHQNPLAWLLRYQWQYFETSVMQIQENGGATSEPTARPPRPNMPPPSTIGDNMVEKLETLSEQIERFKIDESRTTTTP